MDIEKYFTDEEYARFTDLSCKMIENGQNKESTMLINIVDKTTVEEFEALKTLVNLADSKKKYIYNLTPDNLKMPSNTLEAMSTFRKLLDSLNKKGYFDEYTYSSNAKIVDKIVIDITVYNAINCYLEEFGK